MEYLKYHPEYQNKVIELLHHAFPRKNITAASFNWKHFDNFFKSNTSAWLAIENNIVCSFVCFTPLVINKEDKNYNFYSCAVQATDTRYRRKGLVTNLTKFVEL
jgi:hypothetical protein